MKVWGEKTLSNSGLSIDKINEERAFAFIRRNIRLGIEGMMAQEPGVVPEAVKASIERFLKDADTRGLLGVPLEEALDIEVVRAPENASILLVVPRSEAAKTVFGHLGRAYSFGGEE